MQSSELHVFRVARSGRVLGAGQATEWFEPSNGELCHRVIAAHDGLNHPICDKDCVQKLCENGTAPLSRPAVVHRRPAQLTCQRILDEVVVVVEFAAAESTEQHPVLTDRERQVLKLIAEGRTTRQIAELLGVRVSTARTHVENARQRLGARTRAEALWKALATKQI